MDFGMKLQSLRKSKGLSQEALAEKLNVSRQAVSKWESGSGYPEMDKLILLSDLFGVSLDYLIKDNAECMPDQSEDKKFLNSQRIKDYMTFKKRFAFKIAFAVFMIIISVDAPIIMADTHYENLGAMIMLIVVAGAVAILITTGMSSEQYEELEKCEINMSFQDLQDIQSRYTHFKSGFGMSIALGVFMIIASTALAVYFSEYMHNEMLTGMVVISSVAIAVFIFIYQGIMDSAYRFIAQNKKHIEERKREEKSLYAITMPLAAMIFLVIGFTTGYWHPAWIVFPVTAIITSGITQFMKNDD